MAFKLGGSSLLELRTFAALRGSPRLFSRLLIFSEGHLAAKVAPELQRRDCALPTITVMSGAAAARATVSHDCGGTRGILEGQAWKAYETFGIADTDETTPCRAEGCAGHAGVTQKHPAKFK